MFFSHQRQQIKVEHVEKDAQIIHYIKQKRVNVNTKKDKSKQVVVRKASYNWNISENRYYVMFLILNRHLFDLTNQEKKKIKLNVMFSNCVLTRTSTQCHTHHQKMVKKYGSIDNIIQSFGAFCKDISEMPLKNQEGQEQEQSRQIGLKIEQINGEIRGRFSTAEQQEKQIKRPIIKVYIEDEASYVYY